MNKEFILGCHVSLSSPDYYLGSVNEALSYGANTFMIYTGAPQNSYRLPTERLNINKGKEALKKSGMNSNHIIAHAPYIINLGNSLNPSTAELAVDFLKKELQRVADFGIKTLVLHPGSHVGAGEEEGLKQIIKGLNEVLANDNNDDVIIALETMAGKGSEIGYKFEHIRHIIDNVDRPERLGVCLDTCHISDAGYDVTKVDEVLKEFDEVIGLERLRVVHVNDSKNERGARNDRHENLGYGTIGFETISKYVHHPLLAHVPKILETPYYDKKPPYKAEIAMLRAKQFNKNWRDSL